EWTTELRAVLLQHLDCGEHLRPGPIIQRRGPDFDRARVYVLHNTSFDPVRSVGNAEQREPGPPASTATDISTSQDVDRRQGTLGSASVSSMSWHQPGSRRLPGGRARAPPAPSRPLRDRSGQPDVD